MTLSEFLSQLTEEERKGAFVYNGFLFCGGNIYAVIGINEDLALVHFNGASFAAVKAPELAENKKADAPEKPL